MKLTSLILSFMLIFNSAPARSQACLRRPIELESIARVCNDVSDIICHKTPTSDRRSCEESDEYIISAKTSPQDLYNFARGCLGSAVTSFAQFFTDVLPGLVKAMWEATKAIGQTAIDGPETWLSKIRGMYESVASVSADIYEAVKESPGAYFQHLWSQITDTVGPFVAEYDCLKPQLKVEKICGFIAGWLVPPAMLARILVKGPRALKLSLLSGFVHRISQAHLDKVLEQKRRQLNLVEILSIERRFKKLGYTSEEFGVLYQAGVFQKYPFSELKALHTVEGKTQRLQLLREAGVRVEATPTPTVKARPKATARRSEEIEVREISMADFQSAQQDFAAIQRQQQLTQQVRFQQQMQRQGFEVRDITPDDPLWRTFFNGDGDLPRYQGGIDYVPTPSPGLIVRTPQRQPIINESPVRAGQTVTSGSFSSPYLRILDSNSMGVSTFHPARITNVLREGGIEKYSLEIIDSSTNSIRRKTITFNELKTLHRATVDDKSKQVFKAQQNSQTPSLLD